MTNHEMIRGWRTRRTARYAHLRNARIASEVGNLVAIVACCLLLGALVLLYGAMIGEQCAMGTRLCALDTPRNCIEGANGRTLTRVEADLCVNAKG